MARAAIVVLLLLPGFAAPARLTAAPAVSGTLAVSFLYMPPTGIEPTYHTAIWLEDEQGRIFRTLYVTRELSDTEYKVGDACPDWVKQAHWETAKPSDVDAVTGPTPNVGESTLRFDLGRLGVPPGKYGFRLQVHITDSYNILYRGTLSVGAAAAEVALETVYSPAKAPGGTDFVRDVSVRYIPAGAR